MIVITRKTLLDSHLALLHFGTIGLDAVVEECREETWQSYDYIKTMIEDEEEAARTNQRNLVLKMGNQFTDQNGLEQFAISPSKEEEFRTLISSYLSTPVELDLDMIPTGIFDGGLSLSIGDRAALKWLFVERGLHNA